MKETFTSKDKERLEEVKKLNEESEKELLSLQDCDKPTGGSVFGKNQWGKHKTNSIIKKRRAEGEEEEETESQRLEKKYKIKMVTHFEKTRNLPGGGRWTNNQVMDMKMRRERKFMNEQLNKVLELSGYRTIRNGDKSFDFQKRSSNSIHKTTQMKSEIS